MTTENMFEFAARNKLRFPFRGMVSTEDLFDLSVENLDSIFKTLNSQVKQANEESLLVTKTPEDETLTTMIEIVKYTVRVKLEEENTSHYVTSELDAGPIIEQEVAKISHKDTVEMLIHSIVTGKQIGRAHV